MAKVFISYSKKDYVGDDGQIIPGSFVDKVMGTFSAEGISYWIDREGLDGGVTFAEEISRNIRDCDTFLFLSSAAANSSPWTLREISTAIEFGKKVLPVKTDSSSYDPSVALYLSSIQYIDCTELGEEETIKRILKRSSGRTTGDDLRIFGRKSIPWHTVLVLDAALIVLTTVYAILSYMFLWASTLRSTEIMGGLVGYVCEFGLLTSIYYIFRLKRLRKSYFAFPALVVFFMVMAGLLLDDKGILVSSLLLLIGWIGIAVDCLIGTWSKKSLFHQMDHDTVLLRRSDPENVILVYLVIKAVIMVMAYHLGLDISIFSMFVS